MTPRTEIIWLDLEDSLEENRQKISESTLTFAGCGAATWITCWESFRQKICWIAAWQVNRWI